MPEQTLENQISRGRAAESFAEDPVFTAAVERVRRRAVEDWQATRPDDVAGREQQHALLRALERVLSEINTVVNDGKIAQSTLARRKQRAN